MNLNKKLIYLVADIQDFKEEIKLITTDISQVYKACNDEECCCPILAIWKDNKYYNGYYGDIHNGDYDNKEDSLNEIKKILKIYGWSENN